MKNIDTELIDWAIKRIKKDYPNDIALLIGQYGACKLPIDEQKMAIDYYVPITEYGYRFAETFIIEDMGYDFYPMSFERLEKIANFNEPRMIWVLDKSEVIYAKSEEDKKHFEAIKNLLYQNLQDKKKTAEYSMNYYNIAMDIYNTMLFESNLCKVRKAAGGVSSMLVNALVLINGHIDVDGYTSIIDEVNRMSIKPIEFTKIYTKILEEASIDNIINYTKELMQCTMRLLIENKEKLTTEDKTNSNNDEIVYEDLAFWYQEARYIFRKIYYYAGIKDALQCFTLGCYIQIEFDAIQKEFNLQEMDLLGAYDAKSFVAFIDKAKEIESYIVAIIEKNNIVLNKYDDLDKFLQAHS